MVICSHILQEQVYWNMLKGFDILISYKSTTVFHCNYVSKYCVSSSPSLALPPFPFSLPFPPSHIFSPYRIIVAITGRKVIEIMKLYQKNKVSKKNHLSKVTNLQLIVTESESCSVVSDVLWPHGLYSPWNSLGQNTGGGSLSLLQEIVPTT